MLIYIYVYIDCKIKKNWIKTRLRSHPSTPEILPKVGECCLPSLGFKDDAPASSPSREA